VAPAASRIRVPMHLTFTDRLVEMLNRIACEQASNRTSNREGHAPRRRLLVVRVQPRGLLPRGTKNPEAAPRPINARAETVVDHPMFAGAFRQRRAIVPATVYYQRRTRGGSGQSFAISRRDDRPMAFAGLWEAFKWPNGEITRSYCVITTEASEPVASIHHRMPVLLEEEDWPVWLGEQPGDVLALLHAAAADVLQCQPVRGKTRAASR
jgi:putative SOS response-associated peptidase YedK